MSGTRRDGGDVDIDVGHLARSLWSRRLTVLLTTVAFAGAGFLISTAIPPSYKADTRIYIESRESSFTRTDAATGAAPDNATLSPESVESQVSLITSTDVLADAAEKVNLKNRSEFTPSPNFVDRLITRIRPEVDTPASELIDAMRKHLAVYRVENTRVLVIEFSSHDPNLSRDVPNAIAAEYLARQKGALLTSNTNATGWLESEIADLREQVKRAEAKVADFRARSGLLLGGNQNVLATQQLSEITSELSRTRAARAAAEGRAQSIRDALTRGVALDSVAEVLQSPTVQALRERQVALRSQIADLSTTMLDGHPRIRSLRSQLRDLDAEIAAEARKVQASLETEAAAARQRETALNAEMETLKATSAKAGGEEVELRALEREAQAQSQLLESYLTRYRAAVARGSRDYLPVDARIFSEARTPSEPYFPKVIPITAAAGVAGFLVATLAVLMSELFSGRALSATPAVPARPATEAAAVPPPPDGDEPPPADRRLTASRADLLAAIGRSGIGRIVFTGTMPAAGREAVAVARQLSRNGSATVLVDFGPDAAAARSMGVAKAADTVSTVIASPSTFANAIHRDREGSTHVLAADAAEAEDKAATTVVVDALGEAYGRLIVVADLDVGLECRNGDTALVVCSDGDDDAVIEAVMARLAAENHADVILMRSGADASPSAVVAA